MTIQRINRCLNLLTHNWDKTDVMMYAGESYLTEEKKARIEAELNQRFLSW